MRHYLTLGYLVQDHELRLLALKISVSATATERLCLDATRSEDAKMEPTAALHMLAKATQRKSSELVDLIDTSWREIHHYMRTMVTA